MTAGNDLADAPSRFPMRAPPWPRPPPPTRSAIEPSVADAATTAKAPTASALSIPTATLRTPPDGLRTRGRPAGAYTLPRRLSPRGAPTPGAVRAPPRARTPPPPPPVAVTRAPPPHPILARPPVQHWGGPGVAPRRPAGGDGPRAGGARGAGAVQPPTCGRAMAGGRCRAAAAAGRWGLGRLDVVGGGARLDHPHRHDGRRRGQRRGGAPAATASGGGRLWRGHPQHAAAQGVPDGRAPGRRGRDRVGAAAVCGELVGTIVASASAPPLV
ncbi:hypothetical protein BU14_0202s0030 [Porphyra umbilicalis]|uniref:Uncharacterized protein n=1 Tax=Porphyra umbilicalis TaxID=2786 RepID=A0A1X6P6I3_PORUM|nr:hypothetical protein BU14_0202s0030 [Porphyra umbilicalis]|eukprot:OSX76243.1 hypothetical protein BU14_0202s0030 [Porphyra umbilicalis]